MQEFIEMAAGQLGISSDNARSATGGMLQMIQKGADGGDFEKLLGAVPGAAEMLQAPPQAGGGGGGSLLGGLAGQAAGLLGGQAGGALGLVSLLGQSGLGASEAGSFATMFVTYLKGQAGGDLVGKVLGGIPELKDLLG